MDLEWVVYLRCELLANFSYQKGLNILAQVLLVSFVDDIYFAIFKIY